MINSIFVTLGKLSFVAGLAFVVLKVVYKGTSNEGFRSFYERRRTMLYQVHVNASKLAVFLAFLHGLTLKPLDWTYNVTGWLYGGVIVTLLGLGAYLSIRNQSKPMDEGADAKWRTIRIVKWALTASAIILLLLHYKLYDWMP